MSEKNLPPHYSVKTYWPDLSYYFTTLLLFVSDVILCEMKKKQLQIEDDVEHVA